MNGPLQEPLEETGKTGLTIKTSSAMPPLTNGKLKSSLSRASCLKQAKNLLFENQQNLHQIVKQKRENCLQVKTK